MAIEFQRNVTLQLNDREYSSLGGAGFRINAAIERKGKSKGKGTIRIWNLAREQEIEAELAKRRNLRIRLLAGTGQNDALLFDGNVIKDGGKIEKRGPDRVLKLEVKEGSIRFSKVVDVALAGRAPLDQVVAQAFSQAGYEPAAYLKLKFEQIEQSRGETLAYADGYSAYGSFSDVIRDVEETWDIRFRVLGDFIEVSDARAPRTKTGPLFSDALRNILDRPATKGRLVALKTLLAPGLRPGDRFQLDSEEGRFSGFYTVKSIRHELDSGYEDTWQSSIEAKKDEV